MNSNITSWQSSKYIFNNNKIVPTRNTRELNCASRLIATLIANKYELAIPKYCSGNLLDLGCGKAPLLGFYNKYCSHIELADWENSLHQNSYIDHIIDLTQPLPLQSNCYDSIILSDVLEHIPNPESLFNELYRIMANNGILLFNVPFIYWIHEMPYDYYRYTNYALTKFASSSGFKIEVIEPLGGTIEVIADILSKSISLLKLPLIGRLLISVIQNITILFNNSNYGNRLAINTSKYYTLGYFVVLRK